MEESKLNSAIGWVDFAIEKDPLVSKVLILKLYQTIEECLKKQQIDNLQRPCNKENDPSLPNIQEFKDKQESLLSSIRKLKEVNNQLSSRQESYLKQLSELEVENLRKKKIIDRLHSDQELFQRVSGGIKNHLEKSKTVLLELSIGRSNDENKGL